MKSVAFIITRQDLPEFVESQILLPITKGEFGNAPVAIFFVHDGVYSLMKATRSAAHIRTIIEKLQIPVYACMDSIFNRNLQNLIIDGIKMGKLKDFLEVSEIAERILTF